jgi:hypothetical protein
MGWVATPAAAQTQPTSWLGRAVGTEYVFDTRLPADFANVFVAKEKYAKYKEYFTQNIDGKTYSFVKARISWNIDPNLNIDNGHFQLERNGSYEWLHMDGKSPEWKALVPQLKSNAAPNETGEWFGVDLLLLIWPNAETPTVRLPIPETTLAKTKMSELGKQTKAGLYYRQVKIPADLDAFRAQMLAYGNVGRRDADFRKNNGSKTAISLSSDTVSTLGGTQKVFKQSQTPPYFADHVLDDALNQAAQFQAEYQASINRTTHDGPTSFRDPKTGKSVNLFDFSTRVEYFGGQNAVEAAGSGSPGDYPHGWMTSDTHFRPWFNVGGCYPKIGYGAAMAANGTWYFAAVPVWDADCSSGGAAAQPQPAAPSTATSTTPAASAGTTQAASFPLLADRAIVQGQKYRSASGNHYLLFQPDGNVVVYTAADQYVWGLESVTDDYYKAQSVQMQKDGNFVVRGANDVYIWSALTQNPDPSAFLTLTPEGVLLLASGQTSAILWASNGDLTQALPPTAANSAAQQTNQPSAPAAAAPTDVLKLEVGKEYVIREDNGSYRYFKLTRARGETYDFDLCPYAGRLGSLTATGPTNVLSVEAALAQNITPTNESCTVGEQTIVMKPEIGKQYAIREANNTFRYFKLTRARGEAYTFDLCPDPGKMGSVSATRPTNVMRVEVALAQQLTPKNQPCDVTAVPYGN